MNLALFKKYLVLEICGVVILAALAVIGVKLFTAIRQYTGEKSDLQAVMNRKQELDRRVPYPSKENVKREVEKYNDILDNYNELNELLCERQVNPQAMQSSDFMMLFESTLLRLRKHLASAHVAYPVKYNFGFDRYATGKPPEKESDIPLLVQQMRIIDGLCQAMCQVHIAELISLSREEVEGAARSGRPEPPPGEAELYTPQHFKLAVRGNEAACIDLLNLLARRPAITVVTSVELATVKASAKESALPSALAPASGKSGAGELEVRERKIMLGKEQLEMRLELDVYRFAPSLDFRETSGKKR
jgi:hypothetical protein